MPGWVNWPLDSKPQLFIDPKRINPEIQAERRRELDGSVARRRKIMDRMIQGYDCPHPSWIAEAMAHSREDDELATA